MKNIPFQIYGNTLTHVDSVTAPNVTGTVYTSGALEFTPGI